MHLWSEYKIFEMLRAAGFVANNMQLFWRNHLFIAVLAWKPASCPVTANGLASTSGPRECCEGLVR